MIKIKNYDENKQHISLGTDMKTDLANAIRRSALEIPIMAVDEVEITKNDSALYDEMLAHRIGLVPIRTDKASKETKFKLKEVGPKMVLSKDFKPSTDAEGDIPLVLLEKDQELEIVADARLGKGVEHIKYSPGLIYYKHDVDKDLLDFLHIDNEGKVTYNEEEMKNKGLSEEKIKEVKAVKDALELEINIESWGQIDVKEIFTKAIEALSDNLSELDKAVK